MLDLLLPAPRAAQQVTTATDYGWQGSGITWGQKTRSGVTVDEEIALTYAAVLCATRLIAEGVGGLPLPLYRRKSRDEREPAEIEVANLLKFAPNPLMTATPFRESRTAHQVNWDGGGFAEIEFYGSTDRVKWLWPIHPSRVIRSRDPKYDYQVRNNDGSYVSLHAWEMLHIPGIFPSDGIWSKGTISYGRETIGGAIGVDRASYAFLGSGGQPKGILQSQAMGGQDKREVRAAFRKEWETVHANPEVNVPTLAIIGGSDKYTPLEMLGSEANQIIQSRLMNRTDIPCLYKLPAYCIPGCDSKETAGTVETKSIELIIYGFMPWAKKWEEACGFKLLTREQQRDHYFEHNFSALLRGDTAARYNAYRIAFSIGIMTINEIRRLENLPNIGESGDQHFVPANMTTAQRALEGDFGNGGAMGSEQNGQPADNPMDRQAALDREHYAWMRSLGTIPRAEATTQLKALEHSLPERPVDYKEGARLALMNVLPVLLTKEANAAEKAMKGNIDFEQWLREFYAKQEAWAIGVLGSACWCLRAAGLTEWGEASNLAAWLRERNIEALRRCYNGDTVETAARRLRAWPTDRAKELADEIMGEGGSVPAIVRDEPRKPSSMEVAVETLAKVMTHQLETPISPPAPPVVNVAGPVIHNHPAPPMSKQVVRDKDGRISGVKHVTEGGNAKDAN